MLPMCEPSTAWPILIPTPLVPEYPHSIVQYYSTPANLDTEQSDKPYYTPGQTIIDVAERQTSQQHNTTQHNTSQTRPDQTRTRPETKKNQKRDQEQDQGQWHRTNKTNEQTPSRQRWCQHIFDQFYKQDPLTIYIANQGTRNNGDSISPKVVEWIMTTKQQEVYMYTHIQPSTHTDSHTTDVDQVQSRIRT